MLAAPVHTGHQRGMRMHREQRRNMGAAAVAILVAFALPAVAFAHLERPSYWPDPRADKSVQPAAGGKVPKARSLGSAVTGKGPGEGPGRCTGAEAGRP